MELARDRNEILSVSVDEKCAETRRQRGRSTFWRRTRQDSFKTHIDEIWTSSAVSLLLHHEMKDPWAQW